MEGKEAKLPAVHSIAWLGLFAREQCDNLGVARRLRLPHDVVNARRPVDVSDRYPQCLDGNLRIKAPFPKSGNGTLI